MVNTSATMPTAELKRFRAVGSASANPFRARYATANDAATIDHIVRDAFGASAPKSSAARDMKRPNTTYIVAAKSENGRPTNGKESHDGIGGWRQRFTSMVAASISSLEPQKAAENVVGLVGIWTPMDQTHIMVIASRSSERGKGIGELLLLATLSEALKIGAKNATLEVRKSNEVARALYRKYGFAEVGIRRRYYQDNREDAIIMSTPDLSNLDYRRSLRNRCRAYFSTRGETDLQIDPMQFLTLPE